MLDVACYKVRVFLAHLDFVEYNVFGVREHFLPDLRPFKIQPVLDNYIEDIFNVDRVQMKLFPFKDFAILIDDIFVVHRRNDSGKYICQNGKGRGIVSC